MCISYLDNKKGTNAFSFNYISIVVLVDMCVLVFICMFLDDMHV